MTGPGFVVRWLLGPSRATSKQPGAGKLCAGMSRRFALGRSSPTSPTPSEALRAFTREEA